MNEDIIMTISTLLVLELSRNKSTTELEIILLILENIVAQLSVITELKLVKEDKTDIFPVLPII